MSDITCHFLNDPREDSGTRPGCEKTATTFVRVYTGRLCPLCNHCFADFESGSKSMSPDVRKKMPGQGQYTTVTLTDGSDEFIDQPPKKQP